MKGALSGTGNGLAMKHNKSKSYGYSTDSAYTVATYTARTYYTSAQYVLRGYMSAQYALRGRSCWLPFPVVHTVNVDSFAFIYMFT